MVALAPRQTRGSRLVVIVALPWVVLLHLQVSQLKDPPGEIIDSVVAGESYPSRVFFIAGVVIPYPIHHLDEYFFAVEKLNVVPLCPVVQVLLHQVGVGPDVGHLKVQVVLQLLQALHLLPHVFVYTGLEIVGSLLQGEGQSPLDFINFSAYLWKKENF